MNEESYYGKGFTYCLALFLAHEWKGFEDKKREEDYIHARNWFNAAGDHLFEFEAEKAPKELRQRCIELKDKVLKWRISEATWKDFDWACDEAKNILLEYDKLNGFECMEANWK